MSGTEDVDEAKAVLSQEIAHGNMSSAHNSLNGHNSLNPFSIELIDLLIQSRNQKCFQQFCNMRKFGI